MISDRTLRDSVPEAVRQIVDRFRGEFGFAISLWLPRESGSRVLLYSGPSSSDDAGEDGAAAFVTRVTPREGPDLEVEVSPGDREDARAVAAVLRTALEQLYDFSEEIRFFTLEVSERYEEINLLYSISETLGSLIDLGEASHRILGEVCDVMGARRGSLWVFNSVSQVLDLVASVGEDGLDGPLAVDHPSAITSEVFREGQSLVLDRDGDRSHRLVSPDVGAADADSALSVPIRYTPPTGEVRTVGVINLIGRRRGGRFTAGDQKLLSAIASQVGAALENNRLIRESLEQERVAREMELAHNLQMKLLPPLEGLEPAEVAARVEPAESVGGDFYHCFRLPGGRIGVMIGDVSSHGFPAALIMALAMSAATIYASEVGTPQQVLNSMGDALLDELESTEMYLTLFYGVLDPTAGKLTYASAGHPHAFIIRPDGSAERLRPLDLPLGIAEPGGFHQRTVPWARGEDLLLLFTDGLSENLVAESRSAGESRVVSEAVRLRESGPSRVVDALFSLERLAPSPVGMDDRSALVVRV